MTTALLLYSVKEAEYCVQHHLHDGCLLFSTDPAVDIHLREAYGIECRCVSHFLSHAELAAFRTTASTTADLVLSDLDARIAPALNREFDLKMRYFTPLYSYYGKHYLLSQIALVEALRKIVKAHQLRRIKFCASAYQSLLNAPPDMKLLIARFLGPIETEVIPYSAPLGGGRLGRIPRLRRFFAIYGNRAFIRKIATEAAYHLRSWRGASNRKTVLLAEPLYFLGFLRDALSRYNVIRCRQDGYPMGFRGQTRRPESDLNRDGINAVQLEKAEEPFEEVLRRGVCEDFSRGIARYLGPILVLKKIHEKHPISLGVWGNIGGFEKCFLFEYLRSVGVGRVGTQHGNCYVDQIMPWTFESDFNRCDHFISWGFTQDDLFRTFPNERAQMEVHPFGAVLPPMPASGAQEIDVVFPLSLGMSMFDGGPFKMKPDMLIDRQIRILEYLDSLTGRSAYVKPFPFAPSDECAVSPVLKRLKNLKVVDNMFLDEFLRKYKPRAVVIDYPASVLFQTMHLDTEIFLMPDELNPYEPQALSELKKRVHYCEDPGVLLAKLDLFFQGRLERKRDETYYRHYVTKPDARENTLRLIERLAG